MVRFVFGGSGSGKSEYILNEIDTLLRETDRRICLIVPEQHTVNTEYKVAKRFHPSSALRLEATNFTRLADSVSRRVGGLSYTRLTRGADMLMLWRAMMSVWGGIRELSLTGDGDGIGLVPTLYSAARELRLGGVSPEELSASADELEASEGESSLSRRARDLALICSAYASLSEAEFGSVADPADKLRHMAEDSGYFKNTSVFIDSFYSLTGAQTLALAQIVRCAEDVTIVIPMEDRRSDGIHLAGVRRFYESCLSAALKYGDGMPEFVTLEGNHRASSAELYLTQKYLWNYSESPEAEDRSKFPSSRPESVSVFSVSDRYEEAEALCAAIADKVRSGARYSDIAVVCADVERLRGITDTAMRRHGIPCFASAPSKIVSSPAVRLILSLLRIVGRWRREDVISMVKTGLTPLSDDSACIFESYTDIWNIRGEAMFTSPWNMNPDGYREELTDRGRSILAAANEARETLIPHIEGFCDTFDGGRAPVRDICAAIVKYFENTGAYSALMKRADSLPADDGARERLVWREICTAFDTMVQIVGDVECDSAGFSSLFRYVITDADTGAIPTGVDTVTFVGASGLRSDGVRHVMILGAVDGEFPVIPGDDGYFSTGDKERLSEVGIILGESLAEASSEELFRFYRAVAQASESLTVFVPRSSSGAVTRASEGALRIMALTGAEPVEYRSAPAEYRIYDKDTLDDECRSTGEPELISLREERFGKIEERRQITAEDAAVSHETAEMLFGGRLRLTQSRIDTFVKCPLSYYCKYVLKLSEDRPAEISSPDIGTFVHAVLEEFFAVTAEKSFPLERNETERICDGIIESYIRRTCGDVRDGRMKYLFIRLRRQVLVFLDAIMKEAAQSRFETYGTELPVGAYSELGDKASPPPVVFKSADGGEISLYGVIDRLDVYKTEGGTYIRVIDYKTGSKRFSYEDVKIGLNIQLLLYLFSAWRSGGSSFEREVRKESGELLPAGALYLTIKPGDPTSDSMLSEAEAREKMADTIERSGIVTDERDVLDAMDSGITGKYVPVSLKADGTYRQSVSLASLERFGELYREMEGVICRIADEMKSGRAPARPLENHGVTPCEWCTLREICRKRKG